MSSPSVQDLPDHFGHLSLSQVAHRSPVKFLGETVHHLRVEVVSFQYGHEQTSLPHGAVPLVGIVEMDDEAIRLGVELDNLRIDHQHKLRHLSGLPERWAENALRIALVIHCMEHAEHAWSQPVDGSTMERAIMIIRWFIGREMAWMESFDEDDLLAEQLKAKVYKHLQENGPTTARDLGRKAGLKRNSRYLLDKWVEASELVTWDASKGGQPSPTYALKGEDRVPEEIRKGAELGEK